MRLPVMPPVSPMLAKSVGEIPSGAFSYEPKWDGFRSIVFHDGDEVEIGSRNERPMGRHFPEVVEAIRVNLPERCVVDGEIVVPAADGRRLEFAVLPLKALYKTREFIVWALVAECRYLDVAQRKYQSTDAQFGRAPRHELKLATAFRTREVPRSQDGDEEGNAG